MDTRIRIIAEAITKEAEDSLKSLAALEKDLIDTTKALKLAQENTNGATNQQIGIIQRLESEIYKLIDLRKKSSDTTEIAAYNRQIQSQEAELKKLTTVQQNSNVLSKEQNSQIQAITGSGNKSTEMFRNLATAMLGVFAIDRVIDYSKQMFNIVVETDRLNIALKNVSSTNSQYTQSLDYLNKLSSDYGQNLNSLKQSYISFIASSNSTNLSIKERQSIYESIIKAGSALTLSNDSIQGSLVAVSQMFSKGNVSAEELRGQLGERLPGAFGIMAKALGVNEKQLNKMLEQGQVLAEDALPKFAKALEEAYGDKATANINTIGGATNRFTSSLTENLTQLNKNVGATDILAKGINYLADNFNKIVNVVTSASIVLALYTANKIRANVVSQIQLINLGKEVLAKQAASVVTLELTAAETAAAAATIRFNAAMASAPWGALMLAGVAVITMLLNYKDAQDELSKAQERVNGLVADSVSELVMQRNEFNTLAKSVLNTNLQEDERIKNLSIMKQKFPDQMKGINSLADAEAKLGMVIRLTNQDFVTRAKLLENEVKIKYNNELANKAIKEQILLENKLANASTNKTYMVTGTAGYVQTYDSEAEKIQKLIDKKKSLVISTQKANESLAQYSETLTKKVNYDYDSQLKKAVEVDDKKVASNKKANDTTEKQIESSNKEIEKLKKETIKDIEKLEKDSSEIRAKIEKDFLKEREDRNKAYQKSIDAIEKNIASTTIERDKASAESKIELVKGLNARLDTFANQQATLTQQRQQIEAKKEEEHQRYILELKRGALDLAYIGLQKYFDNSESLLDNSISKTNDKLEKAALESEKLNLRVGRAFVGTIASAASGDIGGTISGVINIFSSAVDLFNNNTAYMIAQLEVMYDELKAYSDELNNLIDPIKETYGELTTQPIDLVGLNERIEGYLAMVSMVGNMSVENEVKLGQMVLARYNNEMAKIEEWKTTKISAINSTYQQDVESENKSYQEKIDNINSLYNEEVSKINSKYDLISILNSQNYDAESLAITEKVNADLMAFVNGQELKNGLTTKYESERAKIQEQFALSYKPITEGMTQAEINGINASIEARDEAFAKLSAWQTTQIQFVIDNGQLEIDTFTDVQKIIQKGKDDAYDLSLKYKAKEIQDALDKDAEIVKSADVKDKALEAQKVIHDKVILDLEVAQTAALLAITTQYNSEVTRLSLEKDQLITDSFNRLKDTFNAGYDEMIAKANELYNQGIITAEQFLELINIANNLKDTLNNGGNNTNTNNPYIDLTGLPRFNTGTELVGGKKGIDRNLVLLSDSEAVLQGDLNKKRLEKGINRFQMVEYAINYKSLLSQGMPNLRINSNSIDKMEEHKAMQYLINMNVSPIVEKLDRVENALKSIPIQNFDLTEDGLSRYIKTQSSVTKLKAKRRK